MLIAERMLSKEAEMFEEVMSIGVNATLRDAFTYRRFGDGIITLPKGTAIFVDESRGIANYQDDYFEVFPIDYIISYSN